MLEVATTHRASRPHPFGFMDGDVEPRGAPRTADNLSFMDRAEARGTYRAAPIAPCKPIVEGLPELRSIYAGDFDRQPYLNRDTMAGRCGLCMNVRFSASHCSRPKRAWSCGGTDGGGWMCPMRGLAPGGIRSSRGTGSVGCSWKAAAVDRCGDVKLSPNTIRNSLYAVGTRRIPPGGAAACLAAFAWRSASAGVAGKA